MGTHIHTHTHAYTHTHTYAHTHIHRHTDTEAPAHKSILTTLFTQGSKLSVQFTARLENESTALSQDQGFFKLRNINNHVTDLRLLFSFSVSGYHRNTCTGDTWVRSSVYVCSKHKLMTVTLWTPRPFLTHKGFPLFAFSEAASFPRSTGYGAESWTRWEMRWCASPSPTSCTRRSPRAISWGRSWWWSRYSELSATGISSFYKFTV